MLQYGNSGDAVIDLASEERRDGEATAPTRHLYLDLLKRALTHTLYWPPDVATLDEIGFDEARKAQLREMFAQRDVDVTTGRTEGRDWPKYGQTMVGLRRLDNVQHCVERVLADAVPGDFIETGVWRGGVAILMRGILRAHGVTDRMVVAADSFRGLPPPDASRYPADAGDVHFAAKYLAVKRSTVERNFELYGLLDDQVQFLEGWFRDTLPTCRDRTWAVVRVDGDLYESTMDALVHLYPRLSIGGYLIVDDYAHPACRKAVDDYRIEHGINEPVELIDWTGAFWRRAG